VILIDVDDLKLVNDTYGKLVGDQMLKLVAETLQYSVRTSDYVGRWGGEEFLLILYDVNEPQMKAIAEKLRRLVEHNSLITEKGEIGVTISIGGTLTRPDDTVTSLLERAAAALQESKSEGKNRSTII
jgi:diguanylate cyclase (GGDEF)-like protein